MAEGTDSNPVQSEFESLERYGVTYLAYLPLSKSAMTERLWGFESLWLLEPLH